MGMNATYGAVASQETPLRVGTKDISVETPSPSDVHSNQGRHWNNRVSKCNDRFERPASFSWNDKSFQMNRPNRRLPLETLRQTSVALRLSLSTKRSPGRSWERTGSYHRWWQSSTALSQVCRDTRAGWARTSLLATEEVALASLGRASSLPPCSTRSSEK